MAYSSNSDMGALEDQKDSNQTGISKAQTVEEIGDFWDNNSLDDYWDETHEVSFEVRAQRRRRVSIDPELYIQIESQAHIRGLAPETLVNLWLKERLQT